MDRNPGTAAEARPRLVDLSLSLAVACAVFAILVATSRDFGLVWDEAFTIRRERVLDEWFGRLFNPPNPGLSAFDAPTIERYWPFSRREPDGHPPFYALLGLAGWKLAHWWCGPLLSYRIGPMALMAATSGVICWHLSGRAGRVAGVLGSMLVVFLPRDFAHAHYAHYDMPMTCFWLLSQIAFVASLERRRWIVPFGVCLGLAAGTKFTGAFALAAPLGWALLVELPRVLTDPPGQGRDHPGMRALAWGLPVAVLTLYAIQPAWWLAPLDGPGRFLASNLSRDRSKPLPTMYFGRIYPFALPFANTMVYTAITTPVSVMILSGIGLVGCVRRRKSSPWRLIWPLSWLVLMVVRALPNAPGHDAIRLILPSVGSLAILAGLGASFLMAWKPERRRLMAALVMAVPMAECLVGIGRTYPYTDSYYNAAFGGLKAAERQGFELTYYWETAGPEFLGWVREESGRRPVELSMALPGDFQALLREWQMLPPGVRISPLDEVESPDYIHQRRRGFYHAVDWWLERNGRPRFVIRREGVDLLRVYPHEQWLEAIRHSKDQKSSPLPGS